MGGISERKTEINRRRQRRKKLVKLKKKYDAATVSEKKEIIFKVRALTPGAADILKNWGVEEGS